jgi:hypothetical protein
VLALAGCIEAAQQIEARRDPSITVLSYGSHFILIILPLCALIGAAIGLGGLLAIKRRYWSAIILLLLVALDSLGGVNAMWNEQIARYGQDPSAIVLFYPPLVLSGLALVVALALGLVIAVRWRLRVK